MGPTEFDPHVLKMSHDVCKITKLCLPRLEGWTRVLKANLPT